MTRPGRQPRSRQRVSPPDQVKQVESECPAADRRRRPRPHPPVLPARHRGARWIARGQGRACGRAITPRRSTTCRRANVGVRGMRLLRGAPGTKVKLTIIRGSAADPHVVELTREAVPAADVNGRMAAPASAIFASPSIGANTADAGEDRRSAISSRTALRTIVVDVRRTSGGSPENGLALARVFVGQGTLAMREARGSARETDRRPHIATARSRSRSSS